MIIRFRIEGFDKTKEELSEELSSKAVEILRLLKEGLRDQCGEWQCTDDVCFKTDSSKFGIGYMGRMVMNFKVLAPEHEWDEGYTQRLCRTCGKVEAT